MGVITASSGASVATSDYYVGSTKNSMRSRQTSVVLSTTFQERQEAIGVRPS
jgi:hypothetical protein